MFKVKNNLTTNYVVDIFNINEETINSKRYNLRNAAFVLPRFIKLSKDERNIRTLAAFRTMILNKDISSILEGCCRECRLCSG